MMEVGLRVVRGPDWKWSNQDGGEGHVGTVVEIGRIGSSTSPDKTVVIQWDSGTRTNYRVGYQGAYDLRVLDNAPIGVKHPNIICDGCKCQGVQGMRWKCIKCYDYDLCTLCYMAEKHDLHHPFLRFDLASSTGVKVPKRAGSFKIQAKGIYPGAKIVRGPDWDWDNQDGGEGKPGRVIDIRGWENESGRSVANVTWTSGNTNVYRLGHKGKVDIKYTQDASGGSYYRDHLPTLGENNEPTASGVTPTHFKVGDKVKVDLEVEILKAMQEGHGGWNSRMAEYIGKVGTVHRITERGDVRVQYEGCSNRWTFHAGALTKVHQFAIGDHVTISDNLQQVKDLQKGHGEWNESMRNTLGKVGKVMKVYADGDLRVSLANQTWTFNPACCSMLVNPQQDFNNTMASHNREEPTNSLATLLEQLLVMQSPSTEPDRLVREAAQGHLDVVKEIIVKHPDKVDLKSSGKTALQVAAHQGHVEIVRLLLSTGANLEVQDDDGDTALHYSAFGNQPEITEFLLGKGANINALNKGGCSTLHVAVNKQQTRCVKVLLKHKCDINIQDLYGDTALHDGIGKDSKDIVEMLVSFATIDLTLRNKRGFNVLHHAALKGNSHATEKILLKARQVVDIKKDDGFAPLHLAALNGHLEVAKTLIVLGRGDIEIRNNRKQTPLLLALSQGHFSLVDLLVSKGANVCIEDEDGDTALHLALMRQASPTDLNNLPPILTQLKNQLGPGDTDITLGALLACYMVQQGSDPMHENHQKKTPIDINKDSRVDSFFRQFVQPRIPSPTQASKSQQDPDCRLCEELPGNVTFKPCGHRIVCIECCVKIKKCLECSTVINKKVGPDGADVLESMALPETDQQVRELHRQLQEKEDLINCSICMENARTVAFLCGHSACDKCATPLKTCHMCRKPITRRINLYS